MYATARRTRKENATSKYYSPRVSKETNDFLKSNNTGLSQGKLIDKSIALYRLTFEQSKSEKIAAALGIKTAQLDF